MDSAGGAEAPKAPPPLNPPLKIVYTHLGLEFEICKSSWGSLMCTSSLLILKLGHELASVLLPLFQGKLNHIINKNKWCL